MTSTPQIWIDYQAAGDMRRFWKPVSSPERAAHTVGSPVTVVGEDHEDRAATVTGLDETLVELTFVWRERG